MPAYKRILLKLSGEALMGDDAFGINRATIVRMVEEIAEVTRLGVEVAIVIGGGNIFRIIPGPASLGKEILEEFFETKHDVDISHIAQAFGIPYYICDSLEGLEQTLPRFYGLQDGKCAILEVKTPNDVSANILKKYLNI